MLFGKNPILSTLNFSEIDLMSICDQAKRFKNNKDLPCLTGKVMATLFFEPSTRTRMSFETAMVRLGGKVISMADKTTSSDAKGESFCDTIKTIAQYVDVIVCRTNHAICNHQGPLFDSLRNIECCFINAGDGPNYHPTQALLDYFTIREFKTPDACNFCIAGDLQSSRSINSFVELVGRYSNNKIYTFNTVVGSEDKGLPEDRFPLAQIHHINNEDEFESYLSDIDVFYLNRVQKERRDTFVESNFSLNQRHLEKMKTDSLVLNPGPRLQELPKELDYDSRIKFFEQAKNGVFTRMALLNHLLS